MITHAGEKTRIRKSIPLTKQEMSDFRRWYKSHHTKTDAQFESEVHLQTLDRIKMYGSCHEHTYAKIQAVLKKFEQSQQLNTQSSAGQDIKVADHQQ